MEMAKETIKKTEIEKVRLRRAIKERTAGYILASFGFVASLAWNEAIKSLIDGFFPNSSDSVLLKFVYAFLITILVVIVTVYLFKDNQKK